MGLWILSHQPCCTSTRLGPATPGLPRPQDTSAHQTLPSRHGAQGLTAMADAKDSEKPQRTGKQKGWGGGSQEGRLPGAPSREGLRGWPHVEEPYIVNVR